MKPLKIKFDFSLLFLIAVNLWILFEAVRSNLNVVSTLLIYWGESAIIGFFIVMGMLFSNAEADNSQSNREKLIGIPFFIVHYSIFLFVHLVFIVILGSNFNQGIDILSYFTLLKNVWLYSLFIFLSHLTSFIINFILAKENENIGVFDLMLSPYKRVVLMQLTLILGAWAVILTGNPNSIIFLLFIPLKIIFDVYAHIKEHKRN